MPPAAPPADKRRKSNARSPEKRQKAAQGPPERKAAQQASPRFCFSRRCPPPYRPIVKAAAPREESAPLTQPAAVPGRHLSVYCISAVPAAEPYRLGTKHPEKHRRQSRSIGLKRIHPGRAISRFIPHAPMPQYPPPEWQECSA